MLIDFHALNPFVCFNPSQVTMGKLKKEVRDLDGLRFMMNMLKEVRQRESGITMEINPIMNMYQVQGTTELYTCDAYRRSCSFF